MPSGTRPDPPDFSIRAAFEGSYLGTTWAVVHWFTSGAAGGPIPIGDVDAVANDLQAAFAALMGHFCNSNCHFTTTRVSVFLPLSQSIRRVVVVDAVGTRTGGGLPAQVSALIDWQALDGRRGGKPRSYMPAVDQLDVTESYQVASGSLANLNTAVATYLAAVNAISHGTLAGLTLVDMSFVDAKAYRVTPVAFDIYAGNVRPVLATQRRRVDRQSV